MHKIIVEATYIDPKGQTQFFSNFFFLYVKAAPIQVGPVTETYEETKGEDERIVTKF